MGRGNRIFNPRHHTYLPLGETGKVEDVGVGFLIRTTFQGFDHGLFDPFGVDSTLKKQMVH